MNKKEKIFIVLITFVILVGIFIAFLLSNSKKLPPELFVQNAEKKLIEAELGGYNWKVFGNKIIADSINLKDFEYTSDKTVVSKTNELLTLSTDEKFTVQDVKFVNVATAGEFDINYSFDETGNYFTIYTPELEGTYVCLVNINFYSKGSGEYGFKLVVTDENVYDVDDVLVYKDTKLNDILKIKEIIAILPYSKDVSAVLIDAGSEDKKLIIAYENDLINAKEDLLNNTIALFTLVPELNSISYEINRTKIQEVNKDFYYSRDEVNALIERDVKEYAENSELWKREVIYKEKESQNPDITIYSSLLSTILSKVSEKDIGNYVAINLCENNTSGEINLNSFELEKVLKGLKKEQAFWVNLESGDTNHNKGSLIKIVAEKAEEENEYIFDVTLVTSKNNEIKSTYRALKDKKSVTIKEGNEPIVSRSGDVSLSGDLSESI